MQLAACHVRKFRWNPPLSFPPPTPTGIAGVRSSTIKWNQGHPGYWPPKCKNEIRGVQPHMLRKEKIISIISHPTEGFAKIKSRGSRNKIKKVPSQHPKCSRNKTEGFKVSICVCEIIWNLNKIYQILNPNISKPSFLICISSFVEAEWCNQVITIHSFFSFLWRVLAASFSAQTIVTTKQSIDSIYSNHTTQQNSTSLGTLDFIFPKIYQILNPNISKPSF